MRARTDIYGLGAVLYEMATGRRPFPEIQKSRLTDAILHQNPHLPGALNHRISPGLERIIVKALDKDPEHRYQSAKELRVDLARLGAGASIAVPSTRVEADESAAAAASATTPAAIATPGPTRRKQTILWSLTGLLVGAPEILPGGQVVLFTVLARLRPQNDIAVQSLETGERRVVLEGVDYARYVP